MATRYFARERIFTGCGPNLPQATAVFAVEDLTEDECKTLAGSVQRYFDKMHDEGGHGPWFFELGPSADEDSAAFVNLKVEWDRTKQEIDSYRGSSDNSWQFEVYLFFSVAAEHADIIRDMRGSETATVYLQCDGGSGFETFDRVDCLTWDEIETLESLLRSQLYDMGKELRLISDWHAERQPATFIQAKLGWKDFEEAVKEERADEALYIASGLSYVCVEEIKALRTKPVVYGDDSDNDEGSSEGDDQPLLNPNGKLLAAVPAAASETLRAGYRDPDNYWRNVWLYEQRKAGKTNSVILADLAKRAVEFAPIDSENALRTAIEAIALHHHWPVLKGRAGRPSAQSR